MARIVLVVDAEEKELWVKQAHQELITLSEWLRRAARQRIGEGWPTEPGAPRPVPLSEWKPHMVEVSEEELEQIKFVKPTELALEEAAAGPAPTDNGTTQPANEPSASSASCRRVKIHHLYSEERPCPLCGFPHESAAALDKEV